MCSKYNLVKDCEVGGTAGSYTVVIGLCGNEIVQTERTNNNNSLRHELDIGPPVAGDQPVNNRAPVHLAETAHGNRQKIHVRQETLSSSGPDSPSLIRIVDDTSRTATGLVDPVNRSRWTASVSSPAATILIGAEHEDDDDEASVLSPINEMATTPAGIGPVNQSISRISCPAGGNSSQGDSDRQVGHAAVEGVSNPSSGVEEESENPKEVEESEVKSNYQPAGGDSDQSLSDDSAVLVLNSSYEDSAADSPLDDDITLNEDDLPTKDDIYNGIHLDNKIMLNDQNNRLRPAIKDETVASMKPASSPPKSVTFATGAEEQDRSDESQQCSNGSLEVSLQALGEVVEVDIRRQGLEAEAAGDIDSAVGDLTPRSEADIEGADQLGNQAKRQHKTKTDGLDLELQIATLKKQLFSSALKSVNQEKEIKRLKMAEKENLAAISLQLLELQASLRRKEEYIRSVLHEKDQTILSQRKLIEDLIFNPHKINKLNLTGSPQIPQSRIKIIAEKSEDSDSGVVVTESEYKKDDNRVIRSISDVVKNSRVGKLFSRDLTFSHIPESECESTISINSEIEFRKAEIYSDMENKRGQPNPRGYWPYTSNSMSRIGVGFASRIEAGCPQSWGGSGSRTLDRQSSLQPLSVAEDPEAFRDGINASERQELVERRSCPLTGEAGSDAASKGSSGDPQQRILLNHRAVMKPKDVKYKRITKTKSRSMEELREKLRIETIFQQDLTEF